MTRWRWGVISLVFVCLAAFSAGSESVPVTQLSLQLRRGETEATPPVETPVQESFARFDRSIGDFGIVSGYFDKPVDLTVDANEKLFVLDSGNSRVEVFNSNGQYQSQFGQKGTREGQFKNPNAIDVDKFGYFYVVDSGNNRIQKFDASGKFILQWGSLGSGDGLFNSPKDIAFDEDNNVYVADPENDRIQKFTATGKFIEQWNKFSMRNRVEIPYGNIISLAYDNDRLGYLLALNQKDKTIIRFELDGDYVDTVNLNPQGECVPVRIKADNVDNIDEYIFVADQAGNRILRYSKVRSYGAYQGELTGDKDPFSKPSGLFPDKRHRRFYIADTGNNRVQKFYWQ